MAGKQQGTDDSMSAAIDEVDGLADGEDLAAGLKKKKKLSGKQMVLFIVLPLVLLLGGGTAAFFLLSGGEEHAEAEAHAQTDAAAPSALLFYDLPEMLVNLNTGGRKASYLKLKVALEVDQEAAIPELEAKLPRVINEFQVYLRELRLEDLNGSAGMYRLKEELLVRVNTALYPTQVKDVLFKEMLVQ